jgi:hypothetical protein
MHHLTQQAPACNTDRREFILGQLRIASLRVRLLQCEIDTVGHGVRGRLIAPEAAIEILADIGALDLVGPPAGATA